MQLSDVVEVLHVIGATSANAKLAEGWKLIAVVPAAVSPNGGASVAYVLGREKRSGEGLWGQKKED